MDQDEIKDLLRNHKEAFFSLRRSYKMMLVALIIYTLSFGWCNLKNLEKAQFLEDRVRQLEQTINKQPTCCPPCPEQAPSEADDPKATPSPAPSGSHRIVDGVEGYSAHVHGINRNFIVLKCIPVDPQPVVGEHFIS